MDATSRRTDDPFREMIDMMPALAWSSGPDGAAEFINRAWLEYTGLGADEALGTGWTCALHPDDVGTIAAYWQSALAAGEPAEIEGRLRRFDGEYRWFLFRAKPLRDQAGRVTKWFGTNTDIDDRKRAELALGDSERQLRLIVDTIPAFVCTMSAHGELETANQQLVAYMGKATQDLKEWESIGTVHEEDLARVIARWRHSIESGEPYDIEHRIRRADGVFRWFHVRGLPLRDDADRVRRWYVLLTDIEDRKRAEEARIKAEHDTQESERHLRQFIETLPAIAWRSRPDGVLDFANQRLADYTGKPLQQIHAEGGWMDTIHPEDLDAGFAAWTRAHAAGLSYDATFRVRKWDGEYRWNRVIVEPSRDPEGAIHNWYGLMLDVDDRKRAVDALRESERELRQLVDSIPGMIAVANASGMHEYANRRAMEYVGMSLPEVVELGWINTIHPDERDTVRDEWLRCVSAGTPMDITHRWRRHDGEYRWFHARVEPLFDEHGHVVRWYGLLTDIEDRRRAEQTLSANEARLRLIIDAIPALVWRTSAQGEMEYVNKRATDYTGESFDNAVHSGLTTIHPDDREAVVGAWLRAVETSERFTITYRLRGVDGLYRWFEAEAEPLRDADGRVLNWFGLATNVDENRKMLLELRETRDKLSRASRVATVAELSASIAHEINQPLAAIVSNGEAAQAWLAQRPPDLGRANASLERIVRDGHAAADVVGRIRGLFKHARPAKELSDINAIVRETLRLVDDEIREQGAIVNVNLAEDLPLVPADRIQVQHALLNLVHNAIEAMQNVEGRAKALALTSERKGPHVVFQVSDHGCGVSDAASMFDPFVTTKAKGMGMGLSICRSIIEAHGGQISWSANDGPGSTFRFTLPIDEPA